MDSRRIRTAAVMFLWIALAARLAAADPPAGDLERTLLSCTWSFRNPAVKGGIKDLRFWSDSAATSAGDATTIIGIWHVSGPDEVTILYGPSTAIMLTFHADREAFDGEDGANKHIKGRRLEALLPKGAAKKMQPVAADIDSKPGQSQIDVISSQAASVTAGVIVPLDATAQDHRAAIITLRENLVDEAVMRPVAPAEAYQTATKLCDAWLVSLDERDKRLASYGQTRPTTILGYSRKSNLQAGDYFRYLREIADAHRKELDDWRQAQFFIDAQKKQWNDRGTLLKQGLDALHYQVVEAVKARANAQ